MTKINVGAKIFLARRDSGLSQESLARAIDVSTRTIVRIEKSGKTDEWTLGQIAKATGKSLSYFLNIPKTIEIKDVKIPVVSLAKGDDVTGFEFEQLEAHEYEYLDFSNCKAVRIKGNSMAPLAYDNQRVIYSEDEQVREGDLVFISLKKKGQFFKRYHKDAKNSIVTLLSINIAHHGPINTKLEEIEFMYRVVGVKF